MQALAWAPLFSGEHGERRGDGRRWGMAALRTAEVGLWEFLLRRFGECHGFAKQLELHDGDQRHIFPTQECHEVDQ
jgi:hypothetical protein